MADAEATIAVIGAGPVGMVVAAALGCAGHDVVLLEKSAGLRDEGSKAICVQREQLEMLQRLGAAEPLLERGVSWTVGRTYYRDKELLKTQFPATPSGAVPPFVNISQREVEQALLQRLLELPSVKVEWPQHLVGLVQDRDGVTLRVSDGTHERLVRCRYVVGADGSRSSVRELLAVGFPGHSHPDEFLIADVRAALSFAAERRFYFDPDFNRGRQVLIHPQPDSVWRIDWQVPAGADADEETRSGRMDERIRAVIGDEPYELQWLSTYRFHQRLAERFRVGRVFLAGDSAHLMSPFGARGMNSGIADAGNIAWKLDLVLRGHAPATLLDTYETERRSAAEENLRVTEATMRFMVPGNPWSRLRRNLILRGAVHLRPLRRWVNSGRLSTPHIYDASPIVDRPDHSVAGGPQLGAVVPDAPCRVPSRPTVRGLREVLGGTVTALYIAADDAAGERFLQHGVGPGGPPFRRCVVVPDEPDSLAVGDDDVTVVVDVDGSIGHAYGGADRLFVIRPDLHLASRRLSPSGLEWVADVRRAVGLEPASTAARLGT